MVPVTLRLKNFLSYGTAAGELDFGAFSVACLSGGNGQGKSALLDAITWAVWGEARKSAGAVKPDEELLRVGAREMEVELVFDLEGARYRVVRSYTRTASGKTSKPGLEFHLFDPEAGEYRPLTSENVRATQTEIERRVRLDYDTFINSAFLLQGRSDEFTKKKPGERKEVLIKILGLDRYERLAERAGERWAEARDRVKRQEESIERLQEALAEEDVWRREHEETEGHVAALAEERDRLRKDEAVLAERVSALEAEGRRAEGLRETLRNLAERRARLDAEAAGLRVQVADAEALEARAAEIEAANARFLTLQEERGALDEKATQHGALTHRTQQLQMDLRQARMDLEARLTRLDAEGRADRARLDEDERRLAERPRAQAEFEKARTAAETFRALHAVRQERERLALRLDQIDRRLLAKKNEIQGHLTSLDVRLRQAADAPAALDRMRAEADRLERAAAEVKGWQDERDAVRTEGAERKAQRDAAREAVARLREEAAAIEGRRALVRTAEAETCPTCGTPLTPTHRHTVEASYERELEGLGARRSAQEGEAQRLHQACAALAERFKALDARITSSNGVAAEHVRLVEQIAGLEKERVATDEVRRQAAGLRRQLERAEYETELQAERTQVAEALDAQGFDEAAYEAARADAAHLDRWRGTLEELAGVAERHATLQQRIQQGGSEVARLRDDLSSGTSLAPVQQKLAAVERQVAAVGYDGARHEEVRRALTDLAHAPQDVARLAAAIKSLADWTRRLDALGDEAGAVAREAEGHTAALVAAEAVLAERPALVARLDEARAVRAQSEGALAEAQARLGGLRERLDRCARDREALKAVRTSLKGARHDQAVYGKLRTAFGRHGIPSLIIEEVVPEIEERANELLGRLSNGRTRVALETQGELKKGGTKETLDIKITDEAGQPRAYETFSGGEAFRVNFALRIALAQLLAARSGVRIRTLVVDEGFGTQDQEGVQSLVSCINAIQDDFDKVLVITHLEEMKDAFPVRIEVSKRPVEGSTFEVLGV